MVSIAELKQLAQGASKNHERYIPQLPYLQRPLSYPLVKLFIWLNMSANQVSAFSFLFIFAASFSFLIGSYKSFVIGALLFNLFWIIDCCDGTIARYHASRGGFMSKYGGLVDSMGHDFYVLFIWPAIGIGLYRNPTLWFAPEILVEYFSPLLFIVLGFVITSFALGERVTISKYVKVAGEENVTGREQMVKKKNWLIILQINIMDYNIVLIILLAAIFNFLNIVLIFYATAFILEYVFVTAFVMWKVNRKQLEERLARDSL